MKKIFLIIACLFVFGCTGPADFTQQGKVVKKVTGEDGMTFYTLDSLTLPKSAISTYVKFKAPYTFAMVGDVIVCRDGVIKAIDGED